MNSVAKECPLCSGSGYHYAGMFGEESRTLVKCNVCNGNGKVIA